MKDTKISDNQSNTLKKLTEFVIYSNGLSSGQKVKILKILFRYYNVRFNYVEIKRFLRVSERTSFRYLEILSDLGLAKRIESKINGRRSIYIIINNPKEGVDCRHYDGGYYTKAKSYPAA